MSSIKIDKTTYTFTLEDDNVTIQEVVDHEPTEVFGFYTIPAKAVLDFVEKDLKPDIQDANDAKREVDRLRGELKKANSRIKDLKSDVYKARMEFGEAQVSTLQEDQEFLLQIVKKLI